jgi:hypothetical protein
LNFSEERLDDEEKRRFIQAFHTVVSRVLIPTLKTARLLTLATDQRLPLSWMQCRFLIIR